MAFQYSSLAGRSGQVLAAGRQFRAALARSTRDQDLAIRDLESAAGTDAGREVVRRFSADRRPAGEAKARPGSAEDTLSAVLLDMQTANLLMSGGLALREGGVKGDVALLDRAIGELDGTHADATQEAATLTKRYATTPRIKSPTIRAAEERFAAKSDEALKVVIDEAVKVVGSVLDELKKLDPGKMAEAISGLGQSVPVVALAGRLIRKGIEKLKSALDALITLFGKEAFDKIKDKVGELCGKLASGDAIGELLETVCGVTNAKVRIRAVLAPPDPKLENVDAASGELDPLIDGYRRNTRLMRALVITIAVAGAILAYYSAAVPWLPLAIASTYVGIIAGTVLIATDYVGSRSVLHWVVGVATIADSIRLP